MSEKKPKQFSKMPRKLAEALMEAGVEHYDEGGAVEYLPSGGIGQPSGGRSSTPTTQGNKFDYGKFSEHYAQANAPALMNDYGQMISNMGTAFAPQSQFVATAPGMQNQNFSPQISALQARQAQVYQQQQGLAQALLAQSQGQGPNPAQAMLAQNTGQNMQRQAGMMAGQRGASVNPALLARQAALQGAGIQQQAVGQAATMQAQQQLAAQQALMQQQQNMGGNALQGESIQQGGIAAQNQLSLGAQQINANTAQANAAAAGKGIGGLMSGIGSIAALAANKGGEVPDLIGIQQYGGGGDMPKSETPKEDSSNPLDPSGMIESFGGMNDGGYIPGKADVKGDSIKNDKVPALLSPGEIVIPRSIAQGKNAPERAAEFIRHLMEKGDLKSSGYGGVIEARQKKMSRGGKAC